MFCSTQSLKSLRDWPFTVARNKLRICIHTVRQHRARAPVASELTARVAQRQVMLAAKSVRNMARDQPRTLYKATAVIFAVIDG